MLTKTATSLFATLFLLVSLVSCGGGNRNVDIAGVDGPHVTLSLDSLHVEMTFENLEIEGGFRYSIPRYPNSYLEVMPSLEVGTLVRMSLALNDVLNGDLQNLDPQTLPGGRSLPGVATGSLPAVAFSVENFNNISFYVGPQVFGIFVPNDMSIDNSIASFRYFVGDKRAGTVSIVGNDSDGENGGILLMLDLNSSNKRALKRYMSRF
jgi:hypothetical protein